MALRALKIMSSPRQPLTIMLAGLKGGVAKSTSTWCMACEFAFRGYRVLAVDADPVSQTLYDSYQAARARYDVPFTVLSWPSKEGFVEGLDNHVADTEPQVVFIDTGSDYKGPFDSAALLCDEVIAPVAPTQPDLRRLDPTRRAIEDIALMSSRSPGFAVLLVRTQSRAADARRAREYLEGSGWPLMEAQVPDRTEYRRVFGHVPANTGKYADVVTELLAQRAADQQDNQETVEGAHQ